MLRDVSEARSDLAVVRAAAVSARRDAIVASISASCSGEAVLEGSWGVG